MEDSKFEKTTSICVDCKNFIKKTVLTKGVEPMNYGICKITNINCNDQWNKTVECNAKEKLKSE